VIRCSAIAGALLVGACAPAISGSAANIARLEKARAADASSETVLRSLGVAYFKANRFDDARTTLRRATSMDPKDGVAALYLGLSAEAQNDLPAARAAYESYLNVGQTLAAKRQISDRLTALKLKEIQVTAKAALAREAQLASTTGPANAVAVMPFAFTGPDTSLKPLERGFAELVTTDLSRSPRLTVVERARLQALLDELALQQSAGAQAGSGVRAGKILQVGKMVGGSIQQQGAQLQASAIVTDVRSTSAGRPASDRQSLDQLFTLEKNVVFGLFTALGVQLTTAERNAIEQRPTRSVQAFLAYSRGLEFEDQGRLDDARRSFETAVRIDPNFTAAQQRAQETASAEVGGQVTATTVESSLRGTSEGVAVAAATEGPTSVNSTTGTAAATAENLNPSMAGAATSGGGSTATQPARDPSASIGGDNVSTKTGKVTVVIHQPGKP
jgi:tetratricopeptide (TPR) repeat protein